MTSLAWRRLFMALPVCLMVATGLGFYRMLHGMRDGGFDPHAVNVISTSRTVPDFQLPGLMAGEAQLNSILLEHVTQPVLINFFASWCIPCVTEMPELQKLQRNVMIWGIAYKDRRENARSLVLQSGSPYARTAQDIDGAFGMELGVTGVPESLLVLPGGRIIWRDAAPITQDTIKRVLRPLLAGYK